VGTFIESTTCPSCLSPRAVSEIRGASERISCTCGFDASVAPERIDGVTQAGQWTVHPGLSSWYGTRGMSVVAGPIRDEAEWAAFRAHATAHIASQADPVFDCLVLVAADEDLLSPDHVGREYLAGGPALDPWSGARPSETLISRPRSLDLLASFFREREIDTEKAGRAKAADDAFWAGVNGQDGTVDPLRPTAF
jgi:hypothetical protein